MLSTPFLPYHRLIYLLNGWTLNQVMFISGWKSLPNLKRQKKSFFEGWTQQTIHIHAYYNAIYIYILHKYFTHIYIYIHNLAIYTRIYIYIYNYMYIGSIYWQFPHLMNHCKSHDFMMNLRLHPNPTKFTCTEAPSYELQTQTGCGYLLVQTPKKCDLFRWDDINIYFLYI